MNTTQFIHTRFYSRTAELDANLRDELNKMFDVYKSECPTIEFPDTWESNDLAIDILDAFVNQYKGDSRVPDSLITQLEDLRTKYNY